VNVGGDIGVRTVVEWGFGVEGGARCPRARGETAVAGVVIHSALYPTSSSGVSGEKREIRGSEGSVRRRGAACVEMVLDDGSAYVSAVAEKERNESSACTGGCEKRVSSDRWGRWPRLGDAFVTGANTWERRRRGLRGR
jgi:hypothetical protein